MTYLALGDSYTIGEGVPEAGRWPVQLAAALRGEGIALDAPRIIATTGWTTDELSAAIDAAALDTAAPLGRFDFVSLLIGVNNQYRKQDPALYRQEFRSLLATATRFALQDPARVVVLSIPDWGVTPFAQNRDRAQIAREIDTLNAIARAEAAQAGIAFIDITPVSRQLGSDVTYLAGDKLHYSGKMHGEWARLALPAAQQALNRP